MLLNEITNYNKLEMLEHELYVILISKKQINGNVYPHQWAEDLCTICFAYTKRVDIWLTRSKNIKEEMIVYNRGYTIISHPYTSDSTSASDACVLTYLEYYIPLTLS